jgi:hypothetical protein
MVRVGTVCIVILRGQFSNGGSYLCEAEFSAESFEDL